MNIKQISAEYRDHHGSDLLVVDAARASFGKESEWLSAGSINDYPGVICQNVDGREVNLSKADANLIRYLATGFRSNEWKDWKIKLKELVLAGNEEALDKYLREYKRKAQHFAPFAHPHCTIRITLPIFLARQFVKHQIGGVWSEESRRYINDEPDFWFPDVWHTRPEDVKQGSGAPVENQAAVMALAEDNTAEALRTYMALQAMKVAPEEARIALTLNSMTTVVWTGSLLFWSRVVNQRVDSHAQLAAQELGRKISDIVGPLYPVSWKALTD